MTATEITGGPPPAPAAVPSPAPALWAPGQPRLPLPPAAVAAVRIAVAAAIVAGWFMFFALGLGGVQADRSQQVQYEALREKLALGTAPTGGAIPPGEPVALLTAAAIDLRQVVVEGTASGDLRAGPGHRRDSPLPGQAGVCVVYGRAATFGGPFRRISRLRPGDTITMTTGQGTFTYRIDGLRRAGDPLPDPPTAGVGRLTLLSAEGASWRKGWAPDQLLNVDATLQGLAQPAPSGRPTIVPAPENPMAGDPGAWTPTVLWLQVLVVGSLATAWAQVRWGSAQAWLACSPVVLTGLWGASESIIQLLPNLT